ncbi:hypothetical protein J6590_048013 [Homalodisca vitripennis]|nr:hypothetical protein J6590_048013 [Homalodisca vitripennis]
MVVPLQAAHPTSLSPRPSRHLTGLNYPDPLPPRPPHHTLSYTRDWTGYTVTYRSEKANLGSIRDRGVSAWPRKKCEENGEYYTSKRYTTKSLCNRKPELAIIFVPITNIVGNIRIRYKTYL